MLGTLHGSSLCHRGGVEYDTAPVFYDVPVSEASQEVGFSDFGDTGAVSSAVLIVDGGVAVGHDAVEGVPYHTHHTGGGVQVFVVVGQFAVTAVAPAVHPQVGALLHEVDAVHLTIEVVDVLIACLHQSVVASLGGIDNLLVERRVVGLVDTTACCSCSDAATYDEAKYDVLVHNDVLF